VPVACHASELELDPGTVMVGDGALRYRSELEAAGAEIPPDRDPVHQPRARFHAQIAHGLREADLLEPIYVRAPDAEQAIA
jgi:tRNA threonylcarbamoyladenosine biosynthesis protein TsaB